MLMYLSCLCIECFPSIKLLNKRRHCTQMITSSIIIYHCCCVGTHRFVSCLMFSKCQYWYSSQLIQRLKSFRVLKKTYPVMSPMDPFMTNITICHEQE